MTPINPRGLDPSFLPHSCSFCSGKEEKIHSRLPVLLDIAGQVLPSAPIRAKKSGAGLHFPKPGGLSRRNREKLDFFWLQGQAPLVCCLQHWRQAQNSAPALSLCWFPRGFWSPLISPAQFSALRKKRGAARAGPASSPVQPWGMGTSFGGQKYGKKNGKDELRKGVMLLKGALQVLAPQQGWPGGVPSLRLDAAAAI